MHQQVPLWILINNPQKYIVHTGANEGKETNELNSAKRKQCLFGSSGCRREVLSVGLHVCYSLHQCVCVVCVLCVLAIVCLRLLLSAKTEMEAAEYSWRLCSVGAKR